MAQAAPASTRVLLRRIGSSCVADTARFCPAQAGLAVAPRDQYICLKSYKANLALGCRTAVNAYGSR